MGRVTQRSEPVDGLTLRQREVLRLVAEGMSNLGIAQQLYVSEKAIVRHVSNIYESLGVPSTPHDHRRVHAARYFLAVEAARATVESAI